MESSPSPPRSQRRKLGLGGDRWRKKFSRERIIPPPLENGSNGLMKCFKGAEHLPSMIKALSLLIPNTEEEDKDGWG